MNNQADFELNADDGYTCERMYLRVRNQINKAKDWQRRLLRSLSDSENGDCHPDAARWYRSAHMRNARRIRAEFFTCNGATP